MESQGVNETSLPPDLIRRLSYIRLLLTRAAEESRLAAPYCHDSVNRLHDVAEMFLALATQQHGIRPPKDFIAYWELLAVPLGRPLGHRTQPERFNKVRVGVEALRGRAGARRDRGRTHDDHRAA